MPRTRLIPSNADLYRRCISDLTSVHHVDVINAGHKKLGVPPERYAELVGILVYASTFNRFMQVVSDFLRDGENSELGRLAGLVLPDSSPEHPELFPVSEADSAETPASPRRKG